MLLINAKLYEIRVMILVSFQYTCKSIKYYFAKSVYVYFALALNIIWFLVFSFGTNKIHLDIKLAKSKQEQDIKCSSHVKLLKFTRITQKKNNKSPHFLFVLLL